MPIPPPPRTYTCPACHWSQTVHPRSDVLLAGVDHFDACPRCGHQPLQTRRASTAPLPGAWAKLADQLMRLMR